MTTFPPNLAPGLVVGDRYRVEEIIGRGGFGAVFRATQLNLDRPVALKILLPEMLDGDGILRFQREAELAQRLRHPNTVRVIDFGRGPGGAPFLVFELLEGQTLEAEIARAGGLDPARVGRIAAQILKALMEAHRLGIVHRDVKPANVFLCAYEGEPDFVKVLDLGVAVGSDSRSLTRSGEVVGTPQYMAPEQIAGHAATFASDLFAVGLLMSEALSGRAVLEGLSGGEIARVHGSDGPIPHAPEALRSPLGPVIHRATQKQPERRYASAADMLAHLEALMPAPRPSGATTEVPWPPAGATDRVSVTADTAPFMPSIPSIPPPPAARRARKRSARPWALLGAIGGGAALFALALLGVTSWHRKVDREAGVAVGAGEVDDRPVALTGMHSNQGWVVTFHVKGEPTSIEYKHPGDTDFVSTGQSRHDLDPETNLPRPSRFVMLNDLEGRVPFEVRYRTKGGKLHGPHRVIFDTTEQAVAEVKSHLAQYPNWLSFRNLSGRKLCYFTHLISERHGLRAIRYGIDTDVPDRSVRFTPGDAPKDLHDDETYIVLPADASFVTVEVTFLDGTRSQRRRFPFRVDTP